MGRFRRALVLRALVLAVAVTVLGVPGCGRDQPEGDTVAKPSVTLTATFAASASALTVDYRVVSTDPAPVVLFTGVPRTDTPGRATADPNAVYVTASGDTVELSKRLFSPPDGVGVAAYLTVRGTVLAPGGTFSEQVVVPLPLRVRRPYAGAFDKPPNVPGEVHKVRFCVGSARQDQVFPVPVDSPDTDPSPVYNHGADVGRAQRVVCSDVFTI